MGLFKLNCGVIIWGPLGACILWGEGSRGQ